MKYGMAKILHINAKLEIIIKLKPGSDTGSYKYVFHQRQQDWKTLQGTWNGKMPEIFQQLNA